MNRTYLAENSGMLFVLDPPAGLCMWMKNTLIPLSVAFMDQQGKILNIEEMQSQTLNPHCTSAPASYALEMNSGWFSKRHIVPGQQLSKLPAP